MADFRHLDKTIRTVVVENHVYTVGKGEPKVISIAEHSAQGEGDRWFYDVHFEGGAVDRVFAPLIVQFVDEEQTK